MPILSEARTPDPGAFAAAVILAIAAITAAVWAVDDHFISRREFNIEMRLVSTQLKAINGHLGIQSPPVPAQGTDPEATAER